MKWKERKNAEDENRKIKTDKVRKKEGEERGVEVEMKQEGKEKERAEEGRLGCKVRRNIEDGNRKMKIDTVRKKE